MKTLICILVGMSSLSASAMTCTLYGAGSKTHKIRVNTSGTFMHTMHGYTYAIIYDSMNGQLALTIESTSSPRIGVKDESVGTGRGYVEIYGSGVPSEGASIVCK